MTSRIEAILHHQPSLQMVDETVACGITSKGPWRSSETPGIQQALSNAYLKSQGLYALRDGWTSFTIPSETPCAEPRAGCCRG